jgi:hypothetical protein
MTPSPGPLRIRSDLTSNDKALLRLHRWAQAGVCWHRATVVQGTTPPVYLVELPELPGAARRAVSVGQQELLAMPDGPDDAAAALAELAAAQ